MRSIAFTVVLLAVAGVDLGQQSRPISLAILIDREGSPAAGGVEAAVIACLSQRKDVTLVERREISRILAEQRRSLSGMVAPGRCRRYR